MVGDLAGEGYPLTGTARERLEALQREYGEWKARDLGDTLRQRDLLARQATHDDNEAANLCMILNWTDEEAAIAENALAEFLEGWSEYAKSKEALAKGLREFSGSLVGPSPCAKPSATNYLGTIALLRTIGTRIVEGPEPQEDFPSWEHLDLTDEDLFKLNFVANQNPKDFRFERWGPSVVATWTYHRHTSQLVWAVHGLWPILEGKARLSRCPAPAPDKVRECGRFFVSGGRVGYPARYCSETCRKRAERRRRQREREEA